MRSYSQRIAVLALGLGLIGGCGDSSDSPEFNAASCSMVLGTLNIHWEAVTGPAAPCVGIETTNGVVADAQDGMATFGDTSPQSRSA